MSGEAGVGKSRLAAEGARRAAERGFRTLRGACFDSDRALPFAPLLDLLRAALAAGGGADQLGVAAPHLARLLPELAASPPDHAPVPAGDLEQERRRLFDGLAHFLVRQGDGWPLLLAVEDIHWADETSLDFLLHLARRLAARPVLLLLTYRDDEAGPGLRRALAALDRERLAAEVRLGPLSRDDTAVMLRAIFDLGRPVRADFLEAIYGIAEGNPFFTEEILRSLLASGALADANTLRDRCPVDGFPIPRSVREAVRGRAAWLSAPTRRTLALAAVAGRRFDFALLREVEGCDESTLLRRIKELLVAGLVVEESAERFAFRHALTRQAVYDALLARERRALHRRVAAALGRLAAPAPDAHLADLSYHAHAAGAWAEALEYGRRAGEQALSLYAPRAAAEHFTRGLDAARQLAVLPEPALHRARGLARETLGDFDAARADHEAALVLARAAGDRRAAWRATLDLGALWAGRDHARAGEYYREALGLARGLDEAGDLAQSLNRLGNWYANAGHAAEAMRHHEEALVLFRGLGDRPGLAHTLDLLGMAAVLGGDFVRGTAHYEEAVALFRELDDRRGLASSLAALPEVDPAVLVRQGEEAVRLARAIGWWSGEAFALGCLALCLAGQGNYGHALAAARGGLAIAEEIGHLQWANHARWTLGIIALDLLAPAEAQQRLEQAHAVALGSGSPHWIRATAAALARACRAAGDLARAADLLAAVLDGEPPGATLSHRVCWFARAELALDEGDPALALRIADVLVATVPPGASVRAAPAPLKIRGQALAALGRPDEAAAALDAADAVARARGARPLLWRILTAQAALHHARRRDDEGARAGEAARALIAELADTIPAGPLRGRFREAAFALLPPERPTSPRRAAKRAFGGLTARERQVAALVADGLTNRQIADELSIAEDTATVHVKHILGKLGFASRAQIAAWAARQGLLEPAPTPPRA